MFCTTLRRRSSFASVVPLLISADGLVLKESQLESHDIAVKVPKLGGSSSITIPDRTLRLLLLSPNNLSGTKLSSTLNRIEHFVSLTGGVDVAIILLFSAPKPFSSAKSLVTPSRTDDMEGLRSYTLLHSELMNRNDIPLIPVLPLAKADGLVQLIKAHMQAIGCPKPRPTSSVRPLDLLVHCTTEPPLDRLVATVASDVFPSLALLAQAALTHEHQSLPPSFAGLEPEDGSDSVMRSDVDLQDSFTVLKEQFGENVAGSMLEFWADDFVID